MVEQGGLAVAQTRAYLRFSRPPLLLLWYDFFVELITVLLHVLPPPAQSRSELCLRKQALRARASASVDGAPHLKYVVGEIQSHRDINSHHNSSNAVL